jgi:hypothetical protein
MRKYGRNDVNYATFYSDWMKSLALRHTRAELELMRDGKQRDARRAASSHLRAIERTGSMAGNSSARANARNCVAAAGDARIAMDGAIEIHELFPEFAKNT